MSIGVQQTISEDLAPLRNNYGNLLLSARGLESRTL
ncbi:unnamed protein product [Brassica rapa subsp. trilocularis]